MLATTRRARYRRALVRTAPRQGGVTADPRGEPPTTTATEWVDLEPCPWIRRLHDELHHLGRGPLLDVVGQVPLEAEAANHMARTPGAHSRSGGNLIGRPLLAI